MKIPDLDAEAIGDSVGEQAVFRRLVQGGEVGGLEVLRVQRARPSAVATEPPPWKGWKGQPWSTMVPAVP